VGIVPVGLKHGNISFEIAHKGVLGFRLILELL
jgi:hypothetical protein